MSDAVRVTSVKDEAYDTRTFSFAWDRECRPGQFVMVWVPGTDEVPMSLSSVTETKSITVKAVGTATKKIHELKKGDVLHIRGPYGNGFSVPEGKRMLIVAGGVGAAAVMPLVRMTGADLIIGARTHRDVIFENEARAYSDVSVSTDDGSRGFHGNAMQLMRQKLSDKRYDIVAGCGPEVMLFHLHKACVDEDMECQLSLERYMRCGAGVCGSCMMDDARICMDGPVFTRDAISRMSEFGRFKRDPAGSLVKLAP